MGGGTEWDSRMMDTLKNFDLNSPDVKQQFGKFYCYLPHILQDMSFLRGGSICPCFRYESFHILLSYFLTFYIFSSSDQIGLSPEEVISKIMANPDVARAFQNPRVQAAIMDVCLI